MRRRARHDRARTRRRTRGRRKRLLLVFALIFSPAAARPARAVCVEFTLPPAISLDAGGFVAGFAADVDGDGDADALSASFYDGKIAWHENGGDGGAWTLQTIDLGAAGAMSVFGADVDRDGDTDALAASFQGGFIGWYENLDPGDGLSWTAHLVSPLPSAWSVFAADLDGDGDLDALSGSRSSIPGNLQLAWFENDGAGENWAPHTITTLLLSTRSVAAADVDGDGDLDVLSASYNDDTIAWWANDGAGGGWAAHSVSLSANGAHSVGAVDVDGDGDTDLVSASILDSKTAWYENLAPGTGLTWSPHAISTASYGARSVGAADLDGDGDFDALVGSIFDGKVAWYESRNDGATWVTHTIALETGRGAWSVFTGDVDADGDLDALAASSIGSADSKLAWYRNDRVHGAALFLPTATISSTTLGAGAIDPADVDGDGDLDAFSASWTNNAVDWHENLGAGGWTSHAIFSIAEGSAASLAAADVDGDGDLDAFSTAYWDGALYWHQNDGTGENWALHTVANAALETSSGAYSVFAADIDADGDVDAFTAANFPAEIAWYENVDLTTPGTGNGTSWTSHSISSGPEGGHSIHAADVDGDGDLDAFTAWKLDDTVAWYENLGSGASWTRHEISSSVSLARSVFAADVDGDGDTDALTAAYGDGTVAWFENLDVTTPGSGNGSSWLLGVIATGDNGAFAVSAADLDGDGDLDALVAFKTSGDVAWYENDGDGGGWAPHTLSQSASQAYAVAAADLDGDGDLDALSAAYGSGEIAWYENRSTHIFLDSFDLETPASTNLACWSNAVQ